MGDRGLGAQPGLLWLNHEKNCRWSSLIRKLANRMKHLELFKGPLPTTGMQLMMTGATLTFNHETMFVVEDAASYESCCGCSPT